MATNFSKDMSVHERLLNAKLDFNRMDIKKSGMNTGVGYMFFTLDDITGPILELEAKWRIHIHMHTDKVDDENRMVGYVVNLDNPNDVIMYSLKYEVSESRLSSNTGNPITTKTQNVGAAITYMRRYMYLVIFDIIESDALDSSPVNQASPTRGKPATQEEKRAVQKKLAATGDQAPKTLVTSLKKKLKELVEADPGQKGFVKEVLDGTSNLTSVTKEEAEGFILYVNEVMANLEG